MFDWANGVFAVGTFWFWTFIILGFIIIVDSIENYRNYSWGWATFMFIVPLFALGRFGDIPILDTIIKDPMVIIAFVGGYLLAGVGWSVAKWWFFVMEKKRGFKQVKQDLIVKWGSNWKAEVLKGGYRYNEHFIVEDDSISARPPKEADYRGRIYMWLAFWPWSMIWTLINDPVRRLFESIYGWVRGILDRISKAAFSDLDKEL